MTTQRIAVLDREIAAASADLERVAAEERALPAAAERALGQAVVRLAERGRARAAAEQRVREAQRRHADDLERRDRAWADFADHAGAHRFALTDLPGQEEALRRFGEAVARLDSELRLLAAAAGARGRGRHHVSTSGPRRRPRQTWRPGRRPRRCGRPRCA